MKVEGGGTVEARRVGENYLNNSTAGPPRPKNMPRTASEQFQEQVEAVSFGSATEISFAPAVFWTGKSCKNKVVFVLHQHPKATTKSKETEAAFTLNQSWVTWFKSIPLHHHIH